MKRLGTLALLAGLAAASPAAAEDRDAREQGTAEGAARDSKAAGTSSATGPGAGAAPAAQVPKMTRSERKDIAKDAQIRSSPPMTTWDGRSCDRYESLTACRAASISDFPLTVPKRQPAPDMPSRR